jgi:O-antigen/teichoic acid export membrane protein
MQDRRRKVQQYLTQIRQQSLHTLVSQVIVLGLDFVVGVLVTRSLGTAGRGTLAVASASAAVFYQFGLLGFHNANTARAAQGREPIPVLVSNSLLIAAVVGLISALVLVLIRDFLYDPMVMTFYIMILVMIAVPIYVAQQLLQSILLGQERVKVTNHIEIAIRLIQIGVVLAFLILGWITPLVVLAVGIGVALLSTILCIRAALQGAGSLRWPDPGLIGSMATFGFKAYITALLGYFVFRSDILMLAWLGTIEEVGQYSTALMIVNAIYVLPQTVSRMVFPKLSSEQDQLTRLSLAGRVALVVGALMLPVVAAGAVFSDVFFPFLYGEEFTAASEMFRWLLPGVLFWSVENVLRKPWESQRHATWVILVWAAALTLNLLLNYLLIPMLGGVGAAIASSCSLTLVFVSTLIVFARGWLTSRLAAGV